MNTMNFINKIITILVLCIISTASLCAKSFYYKYLYTVDRDGMKRINNFVEKNWNTGEQPIHVFFSDDYSSITFGPQNSPYVWRLKYTKTHNRTFYYDILYIPGLQTGQPSTIETSSLAGKAAGNMTNFFILGCGQPGPNLNFNTIDFNHTYPRTIISIPQSPLTVLVKDDLSKINIVVHKSGDTIVLERSSVPDRNEHRDLPNLIE